MFAAYVFVPYAFVAPGLVVGLRDLGYDTVESAQSVHPANDGLQLVIDILAPSYGSQMLTNQIHGDLILDEIPGLKIALARAGKQVEIAVVLRSGETLELITDIPEPLSALSLKLMAWNGRHAAKDALDVWRMLRVFRVRIPNPPLWSGRASSSTANGHCVLVSWPQPEAVPGPQRTTVPIRRKYEHSPCPHFATRRSAT